MGRLFDALKNRGADKKRVMNQTGQEVEQNFRTRANKLRAKASLKPLTRDPGFHSHFGAPKGSTIIKGVNY